MSRVRTAFLVLLAWSTPFALHGQESTWLDAVDPVAGMGVNIHFTDAKPGELEMLSRAGFHCVRMDFGWGSTEKKSGVYDFSAYDRLLASLDKFHLHALFILDYGNALYDHGLSPHTDEGRAAFARWAVAVVTHFQGRGVVWEIWNEPNGHFWKPRPNAADYAKLAVTASKAMNHAAPGERVVGPALGEDDVGFIKVSAKASVLNYWSAITIHPYFRFGPESYGSAYDRTKALIHKYAPPGKKVDVMCGESGYSSSWWGMNDEMQGKYLARLLLFDVMSGVPLTIWYDWHNDGVDPANSEHNFGIVHHDYHAGAAEVYDRKPAYEAAQTYSGQLAGLRFRARLRTKLEEDYILSFSRNGEECLVAWTAAWTSHDVIISVPDGIYTVTSYDGKKHASIRVTDGTLTLHLDGGPQYLKRTDFVGD